MRKSRAIAAALALPLLAGCAQNFSEVAGNVRVQGSVSQNLLSPDRRRLSLHLVNARTGAPLHAMSVEVKPASGGPIQAAKIGRADYTADFADSDRVEVLIETAAGTSIFTLQRR